MGEIRSERSADVARVTLHDPAHRNALSVAMWDALRTTFTGFAADDSLRCIVIRGAAGHFAGGADISEFPRERFDEAGLRHYHEGVVAPALQAVGDCPHPVVAAIEGACVGGGLEIAGRCDIRLCAASARLGVPIHRLGFPMAPRELAGLLALAGPAVAAELLFEGRLLSGREAFERGLVTRVVDEGALEAELEATVGRILLGAPQAARLSKWWLRRLAATTDAPTDAERAAAFRYAAAPHHHEGVRAFLEKRTPRFDTGDTD